MTHIKTLIVVALIIGLIICAFFAGSWYVKDKEQKEKEIITLGFHQTAIQITQSGNVPIVTNGTIQWLSLKQLCGGQ